MSQVKSLTDETFEKEIAKGIVLVDFYSVFCAPCRMLSPEIEQLATDYQGKITVAKVDVEENSVQASQFGITAIPTVILFQDGKEKKRFSGFRDKNFLSAFVDEVFSK